MLISETCLAKHTPCFVIKGHREGGEKSGKIKRKEAMTKWEVKMAKVRNEKNVDILYK